MQSLHIDVILRAFKTGKLIYFINFEARIQKDCLFICCIFYPQKRLSKSGRTCTALEEEVTLVEELTTHDSLS